MSFRRDDAAAHARRLRDALAEHFGSGNVLLGGRLIGGVADRETVADTLGNVDIVLAVIGPGWLRDDGRGNRRIDDPGDYVRVELDAALTRPVPVIPVLVAGAPMPDRDELPDVLRPLLDREGPVSIRDGAWDLDVGRLLDWLEEMMIKLPLRTGWQLRARLRESALAGVVPAFRVAPPRHPAPRYLPTLGATPRREPGEVDRLRDKLRELELNGAADDRARSPAPLESGGRDESVPTVSDRPPAGSAREPTQRHEIPAELKSRLAALRVPLGTTRPSRLRRFVPIGLVTAGLAGLGLVVAKWLLGWFVAAETSELPRDTVVCTVFAPPSAAPGQSLLVQAFAHLAEQAADATAIATELDTEAQRRTFQSLLTPVPPGGRLDFELRMPGLDVDEPVASLIWHRRAEAVQFGVRIPPETAPGPVIGTLDVSLASAPVGHVKFKLVVDQAAPRQSSEPQGESARRYSAAFISYASRDREKVLARVQMLAVIGVRYFQDLLSLEPGERWAKKIELGIDECDLFLLFWSSESKRSEWVRKEVAYALARRGDDELAPPEIRPVIVEGPPIVEPWEELAHLHFNDRLLYFMRPPER